MSLPEGKWLCERSEFMSIEEKKTMRSRCPLWAGLGLLLLLSWLTSERVAVAHPVSQNALDAEIFPDKITLHIRVATEEVFVASALGATGDDKGNPFIDVWRKHAQYLLKHFQVSSDGEVLTGRLVNIIEPGSLTSQSSSNSPSDRVVYDFEYALSSLPRTVRIRQNVLREFEYAPGNPWEATYVVRIGQHERQSTEGLLLTFKEPLVYACDWKAESTGDQSRTPHLDKWRMVKEYLRHGIMHILSGYDHLLFIGALVLATVTLWDLVKVITAFTLAHTITLTLAVLDLVRLPSNVVEPMIAASIVFVAVQNVFWPERTRGWSRLAVAFFFGLFHGLGFAGGLLSAMEGMAGMAVGLAIIAFSIGVEVGHQIVVLPVFCALKLARATQPDEARRNQITARARRYGSAAISMAGIFYLIAALR